MRQTKVRVPRGMLFVYDRKTDNIVIPEYSPNALVGATPTAASIATLSDNDGEVEIDFLPLGDLQSDTKQLVFSGYIECGSGNVSLCFMADEEVTSVQSRPGTNKIVVTANADRFPSEVSVYVEHIEDPKVGGRPAENFGE